MSKPIGIVVRNSITGDKVLFLKGEVVLKPNFG